MTFNCRVCDAGTGVHLSLSSGAGSNCSADLDAGLIHDTIGPRWPSVTGTAHAVPRSGILRRRGLLHTGNLIGLVMLRVPQAGRHPIALAGGAAA